MVQLPRKQRQFQRDSEVQHRQLRKATPMQYKKDSLFKHGMKPLSKSLVFDKNWKRSCHGVEYYPSDIRIEGRKSKYYKVLTFRYSFLFEGDSVQFCSCLPYSY